MSKLTLTKFTTWQVDCEVLKFKSTNLQKSPKPYITFVFSPNSFSFGLLVLVHFFFHFFKSIYWNLTIQNLTSHVFPLLRARAHGCFIVLLSYTFVHTHGPPWHMQFKAILPNICVWINHCHIFSIIQALSKR
jgi:hypothetical protein